MEVESRKQDEQINGSGIGPRLRSLRNLQRGSSLCLRPQPTRLTSTLLFNTTLASSIDTSEITEATSSTTPNMSLLLIIRTSTSCQPDLPPLTGPIFITTGARP